MSSYIRARNRLGCWLLHWRWLVMLLLGLTVAALEVTEHSPLIWRQLDRDFLQETILLGVVMPLAIGFCLTAVARLRSEVTVIRITTIETERTRLARDLHDTVGQNLAYLRLRLEQLGSDEIALNRDQIQHELVKINYLVDATYEQVRGKLVELRPPASPDLAQALREYARVVGERAHFSVDFRTQGLPRPLPERTEREVLYLFREALINIEKHARARCVTVDLTWLAGSVTISVADDGTGFEPQMAASGDHLGLKIMSERAREINGRLTFRSRRSLGTELRLWFPVDAHVRG